MLSTLEITAGFCILSFLYMLVIPYFAETKRIIRFFPPDVKEAAANHPDPSYPARTAGYLLTAAFASAYAGSLICIGRQGLRNSEGFGMLFMRYLVFMYGYKVLDIAVQDQYLIIMKKYFVRFFPETKDCRGWNDTYFNRRKQRIRIFVIPLLCAAAATAALIIGG